MLIPDTKSGDNPIFIPLLAISFPQDETEELIKISRDGDYMLKMIATPGVGLPYGSIPRLIFAWLGAEVSQTKSQQIQGKDLMIAMRQIGVDVGDGEFKEQFNRLASTTFQFTRRDSNGVETTEDMRLFEYTMLEQERI